MPIEDWKPKEPAMMQKEPATTSQARRPPSGKVCSSFSLDGVCAASRDGEWEWNWG